MRRHTQDIENFRSQLSDLDTDWKDPFSDKVLELLNQLDSAGAIEKGDIIDLLSNNFNEGMTLLRLFLEKSKDEFTSILKRKVFHDKEGVGVKLFRKDKDFYVGRLISELDLLETIYSTVNKTYSWNDIILERLKVGRGSALKGQIRGRQLEDFVENVVKQIFPGYDLRCNFIGKNGQSEAKADFAIPSKEKPSIVIEVKAYGATGSKQTDSLGDIEKIIKSIRRDTYFLFVTDGITWIERKSDLRKIIDHQNDGAIYRIYTKKMEKELFADLSQLKIELNL